MPTNAVFDAEELLERMGGDRELLGELLELFREDADTQSAQLQAAIEVGDANALFEAAHALKGSASNFMAKSVVDLSFELESLGRSGSTAGAGELFAQLQAEIRELLVQLTAFLSPS